jgi:hypothetical protein
LAAGSSLPAWPVGFPKKGSKTFAALEPEGIRILQPALVEEIENFFQAIEKFFSIKGQFQNRFNPKRPRPDSKSPYILATYRISRQEVAHGIDIAIYDR